MFGDHDSLIKERIKRGQVVLVLGAGANAGSENRRRNPIVLGKGLAQEISSQMGETYRDEGLAEVVTAAYHIIGRDAVRKILMEQFRFTSPSKKLQILFNYTWNRIYTWNYDDALELASKSSVQRSYFYNGMADAVEEIDQIANLQVVFLHGQITKLDKGIILSKEEYSEAFKRVLMTGIEK